MSAKRLTKSQWQDIKDLWDAGRLSIAAIAKNFGITDAAIHRCAKRNNWTPRRLDDKVRLETARKLVGQTNKKTDEEIIDDAATEAAALILSHRKDIKKLRDLENKLLIELGEAPHKTWVGQHQGEVVTHDLFLTASEKSTALKNLAGVQNTRIALERQAFNLDEVERNTDKMLIDLGDDEAG